MNNIQATLQMQRSFSVRRVRSGRRTGLYRSASQAEGNNGGLGHGESTFPLAAMGGEVSKWKQGRSPRGAHEEGGRGVGRASATEGNRNRPESASEGDPDVREREAVCGISNAGRIFRGSVVASARTRPSAVSAV